MPDLIFYKIHGLQGLGLPGLDLGREDSRDLRGDMPAAPGGKMGGERSQAAPAFWLGAGWPRGFSPELLAGQCSQHVPGSLHVCLLRFL